MNTGQTEGTGAQVTQRSDDAQRINMTREEIIRVRNQTCGNEWPTVWARVLCELCDAALRDLDRSALTAAAPREIRVPDNVLSWAKWHIEDMHESDLTSAAAFILSLTAAPAAAGGGEQKRAPKKATESQQTTAGQDRETPVSSRERPTGNVPLAPAAPSSPPPLAEQAPIHVDAAVHELRYRRSPEYPDALDQEAADLIMRLSFRCDALAREVEGLKLRCEGYQASRDYAIDLLAGALNVEADKMRAVEYYARVASERLALAEQEAQKVREALTELVACKGLKERIEATTTESIDHIMRVKEYERRKEPAWAAARDALSARGDTKEKT